MTVEQLIKELLKQDLSREVILAGDEHGNSFGDIIQVQCTEIEEVSADRVVVLWPRSIGEENSYG
jgi:hypothetical protein